VTEWAAIAAVLRKDLRSELRTRSALGTLLMFSFTMVVILALVLRPEGLGLTETLVAPEELASRIRAGQHILTSGSTEMRATLLSAVFWLVMYFSAMAGIPRTFVKEEELRTAAILRLTASPRAVFVGKLLFNLLLLLAMTVVVLPLFLLWFHPELKNWPAFLAHVFIGAIALGCGATILGAIVARAANGAYLMAVLGFGPLLPVLALSINGTAAAMHGTQRNELLPLVSYIVLTGLLSGGLFERVWSD
jgi:heme exporter protein B